ncbi:MAG TPA: protease pro-enzyme activation domain-containing protein [Paraburkholderia sp.]|nr:protease pro-enzyme activation domain-containing protein [Paraburkholderia sp.]
MRATDKFRDMKSMVRHGFTMAVFALTMLVGVSTGAAQSASTENGAQPVRLAGHVLPAVSEAVAVSGAATGNLSLTLVLKRDDEAGFQRYLADVYDERSPRFHQFLDARQIAEEFGPSQQAYDDVAAWLRAQHLQVDAASANRLTVNARGVRGDIEQAFGIELHDYALGQRRFFATDREPAVPAAVAPRVQFIAGLSNFATPHPPGAQRMMRVVVGSAVCSIWAGLAGAAFTQGAGPNSTYNYYAEFVRCFKALEGKDPAEMLNGADPPPPAWQDADGTGQTIGLVEFDTYTPSDVADYIDLIGLPAAKIGDVSQIHVDGGAGATPGANQDEVLIDIDAILTLAPGAKIAVYDAPFDGSANFQGVFNAMIGDGVDIISNSWTYCEDQTTLADAQSIDSILQSAAASGISVLNASGDSGSTCLDGRPNTVGVPADSPNATAVGGTSLTQGPGHTYGSETWWDGTNDTPPTGQGGFGVSRFFARPAYQNALSSAAMRSVPDVTFNADPAHGVVICNASEGGCPTDTLNGGTSLSAPEWAAFTALLNQTQGSNLGALNPSLYPLGNTSAFHNAASMGSDFAHVGLGSPKLAMLHQALTHQSTGAVSASVSRVWTFGDDNLLTPADSANGLVRFDDGVSAAYVVVTLADANGNLVVGKTVTLTSNAGSHAVVSPSGGIVTGENGTALFKITDLIAEPLMFTAKDTSDAIVLADTANFDFIVAPAASGGIVAFTDFVAADGVSTNLITVTLKDALNRPTPGKQVTLLQTGSSVIKAENPSLTDASGQVQFVVTDTVQETLTYTASDTTDGDVAVPGSVTVTFSAGGGDNCGSSNFGNPNITAADGFAITPYATGFLPKITNFGGLNDGCRGASGLAFDAAGNLFVSDVHTGNIYRFPAGGGVAGAATLVTPSPLGPGIEALVFGKDGKLYAAQNATTGNFFTGAVFEVDPAAGTIVRTVASSITCASFLATDPFSGDLFVDDSCSGAGSDNGSIWRINNPGSATPATTVYAATGGVNGGLAFAPAGTLYVIDYTGTGLAKVTGTTASIPGQLTPLTGITGPALDILALGAQANGDAQTLIASTGAVNGGLPAGMKIFDATTTPISPVSMLVNNAYATVNLLGPDGCLYAGFIVAVYKITNADGSCPLVVGAPSLGLTPLTVLPNPAEGTAQTFTARFHHASVPAGTPVTFVISGANARQTTVATAADGSATLTYAAINAGSDTIIASATIGGVALTSNPARVNWTSGTHTTFLTLNVSALTGTMGRSTTVSAALSDVSSEPPSALAGQTVVFTLGAATCTATTNASGVASCAIMVGATSTLTLRASYAGNASYLPSSDSAQFETSDRIFSDDFEG